MPIAATITARWIFQVTTGQSFQAHLDGAFEAGYQETLARRALEARYDRDWHQLVSGDEWRHFAEAQQIAIGFERRGERFGLYDETLAALVEGGQWADETAAAA